MSIATETRPAVDALESSSVGLQRSITWKAAVIVSLGGSMLVAVSLGPLAKDLGTASVPVWWTVLAVGVLQCLFITELAGMFPDKSGGTATYAHEGFKDLSPLPGALSNWGYWLGWLPVIAVNLILAATYVRAVFLPSQDNSLVLPIAGALAIPIYIVNYYGLKPGVWMSVTMAVCAVVPLLVIALSPIVSPGLFIASNVFPMVPPDGAWTSAGSMELVVKWLFVAAWSAYAFESASSVVAEMRNPEEGAPKAIFGASAIGVLAYGLVPFMLLAILGTATLSEDPLVAFIPAANQIFGSWGGTIVGLMLICALLLGVQTAVIGCSRTLYEMSRDGLTLKQFGYLNKYGVPVGCIAWDLFVTLALVAAFGTDIINIVAASNVGYLVPMALTALAYVRLRRLQPARKRPFRLGSAFSIVAMLTAIFNIVLLFLGAYFWGRRHASVC